MTDISSLLPASAGVSVTIAFAAKTPVPPGRVIPYKATCEALLPDLRSTGRIEGDFYTGSKGIQRSTLRYAAGTLYSEAEPSMVTYGDAKGRGFATEDYDLGKFRRVLAWDEEPENGCWGHPIGDLYSFEVGSLDWRMSPPHWKTVPFYDCRPVPVWVVTPVYGGLSLTGGGMETYDFLANGEIPRTPVLPSLTDLQETYGNVFRTDEVAAARTIIEHVERRFAIVDGVPLVVVREPFVAVSLAANGKAVHVDVSAEMFQTNNPGDRIDAYFRLDEIEEASRFGRSLADALGVRMSSRGTLSHLDRECLSMDARLASWHSAAPRLHEVMAKLAWHLPTPAVRAMVRLQQALFSSPNRYRSSHVERLEVGERTDVGDFSRWREEWIGLQDHLPPAAELKAIDARWGVRLAALNAVAGRALDGDGLACRGRAIAQTELTAESRRTAELVRSLEEHLLPGGENFLTAWTNARDAVISGDEAKIQEAMSELVQAAPARFLSAPAQRRWAKAVAEIDESLHHGNRPRL